MPVRTKPKGRGGRPRKFNEGEALTKMQRHIWTTGLSGVSLDSIARSAGLNRPSLAAAFGDKDAIYAKAAARYAAMMDARLSEAFGIVDLSGSLQAAFEAAIDVYTTDGPDGCFILCTAPAEALTNPVCRTILEKSLETIDAAFLRRLELERGRMRASPADLRPLAGLLGSTFQSVSLRARAGWSPERLRSLAAVAIRQVVSEIRSARKHR